jgi:hypothetical protein
MPTALPTLSPLWRNSLRTWLAATLTIGIMLWADRGKVMLLGLLMVVVFINDNDLTPLRSISQMVAGSVIGILTAVVLHNLISGWAVTAIGLLITGILVRALGLLKGLSLGYLSCWGLEVVGDGVHFNGALAFDLAYSAVVGIAMAQLATWIFWPRRPLQQLPLLEQGLCRQLSAQLQGMEQWLDQGGSPPQPLRSQTLLPAILELQQLRDQRLSIPTPKRLRQQSSRWAQTGFIWRQLMRQWLLLEPLLLELPAPLPDDGLFVPTLHRLRLLLLPEAAAGPQSPGPALDDWLQVARRNNASPPLILAIAQQLQQLQQLLRSRALVRRAIDREQGGAA